MYRLLLFCAGFLLFFMDIYATTQIGALLTAPNDVTVVVGIVTALAVLLVNFFYVRIVYNAIR